MGRTAKTGCGPFRVGRYGPCGPVAQWSEQGTHNPLVVGSIPTRPTWNCNDRRGRPQVELLRDLVARRLPDLAAQLTIDTADGFQGDERDVMIMSPVISQETPPHLARFAGRPNRVNVAITRARARLIIVGDRNACLASPTVLAELASHATEM